MFSFHNVGQRKQGRWDKAYNHQGDTQLEFVVDGVKWQITETHQGAVKIERGGRVIHEGKLTRFLRFVLNEGECGPDVTKPPWNKFNIVDHQTYRENGQDWMEIKYEVPDE